MKQFSRKITRGTQLSRTIHISKSVFSIFFGKNIQLWRCWSTCSGKSIHLEDAPHGRRKHTINVEHTWRSVAECLTIVGMGKLQPPMSSTRATAIVKFGLYNHLIEYAWQIIYTRIYFWLFYLWRLDYLENDISHWHYKH